MPGLKRFTVRESRSVQVEASNIEDAMRLAEHTFNNTTMDNQLQGNTISKISVTYEVKEKN